MTTTPTKSTIFRGNEDDEEKRRIKNMLTAAIVSAAVGLLATKIYLLYFWPW